MSVHGVISAPAKAAVYCAAGPLSCEGDGEREREGEGAGERDGSSSLRGRLTVAHKA